MNLDILSEFLGTMVLVLLGNGVVASVSYKKMYGNQHGKWIVITMAWGFAVMMGVVVSLSLGGNAHLNPAVSLFTLISSKGNFEFWRFIVYIIVQVLGAMVAQSLLFFLNWKHLKENDLDTIKASACTGPNIRNAEGGLVQNISYEFVGSMVLLGLILAFGRGKNQDALASLGPLPVTFLVMSIGMSLGAVTGYAINPARDFGPRMVFYITTKFLLKHPEANKKVDWGYAWIPVAVPLFAGVVMGLFGMI
ncbi:MIP/aquaporin family protein [Candidatus Mycoplasma pogonae]